MTEDEIVEAMHNAYRTAGGPIDPMRAALRIALPWAREQVLADRDAAAANAKEFRAATERACDEAIVRYKHEARTAREQALREAAAIVDFKRYPHWGTLTSLILALIPSRPTQEPHQ